MASTPIKRHPELRHVLAHIVEAIEELAAGRPESAKHELEGIQGLIFFENDDEMEGYLNGEDEMHEATAAGTEAPLGEASRAGQPSRIADTRRPCKNCNALTITQVVRTTRTTDARVPCCSPTCAIELGLFVLSGPTTPG